MATTVKRVEKQIRDLEGFRVTILYARDWRDVRSDRHGLEGWRYTRAAKDAFSVAAWKKQRFKKWYPGFRLMC